MKKSTKESPKKKVPSLCYVCGEIMTRGRCITLAADEKHGGKKLKRHIDCYPGSYSWMISEVGKNGSMYKYFLTEYKNDPEFKDEYKRLFLSKEGVENSTYKDSPSEEKKSKLKKTGDHSVSTNDSVRLLNHLKSLKSKKEQAQFRRELRKKGIYISELKKGG